jgi:hypothetical protein
MVMKMIAPFPFPSKLMEKFDRYRLELTLDARSLGMVVPIAGEITPTLN